MWTVDSPFDTWTGKLIPGFRVFAEWSAERGGPVYRRFKKQPGKKLLEPEGQAFLKSMILMGGEQGDPLIPWLAREYKNGNIFMDPSLIIEEGDDGALDTFEWADENTPVPSTREPTWYYKVGNQTTRIIPATLRLWSEWYNATEHPLRRGVNVQDKGFTTSEINRVSAEFQQAMEDERRKRELMEEHGTDALDDPIDHKFEDGWTVRKIDTPERAKREGEMMDHCFSDYEDDKYPKAVESGEIEAFSLRDPDGWPHATWHYNMDDNSLAQVQGVSNHKLNDKYQGMFDEWAQLNNRSTDARGDNHYPEAEGEDEPEERGAGEYEVEISDLDEFESLLDSHSSAEDQLAERYSDYVEMLNEDVEENVRYVDDGYGSAYYSFYTKGVVDELIRRMTEANDNNQREKTLYGTDDFAHTEFTSPEKGPHGYGSEYYLTDFPQQQLEGLSDSPLYAPKWMRNNWGSKEGPKAVIDDLLNKIESAIEEDADFGTYDIAEVTDMFFRDLMAFKPRNESQKEAWGVAVQEAERFISNATPYDPSLDSQVDAELDWESIEEGRTLADQAVDPSMTPPLWYNYEELTGAAELPSGKKVWNPTGYNEGTDETKAVPWWWGTDMGGDPSEYSDIPSYEPMMKAKGVENQYSRPNIFTRSSVGEDYPWDTWTGQRIPGRRTGAVEGAGPYLRRVMKQPGKQMMTDEGEAVLQKIAELGEDADPLAPWLVSRYKKGDLTLEDYKGGDTGHLAINAFNMKVPLQPFGEVTRRITSWYNATDHPLRQGVNIQEMNTAQVYDKAAQHNAEVRAEEKKRKMMEQMSESTAPVVYKFDNGWTIRELHDREHLEEDTLCMGHCVGDDPEYNRRLQNGEIEVFSLRDPDGIAHATWHYNDDGNLEHIQGSSGIPKDEYMSMINEWSEIADRPTNVVGDNGGYDQHYIVRIDDVSSFLRIADGSWMEYAYDDYNANIGEDTEIDYEIDYDDVWRDLKAEGVQPADWEKLFEAMVSSDIGWWDKTIEEEMNSGELESPKFPNRATGPIQGESDHGPEIAAWWRGMKEQYTNPYGDTQEPEWPTHYNKDDATPLDQWKEKNMPPLWAEKTHYLEGEGDIPTDSLGRDFDRRQIRYPLDTIEPWWAGKGGSDMVTDLNQPDNMLTRDRAIQQAEKLEQPIEQKYPWGWSPYHAEGLPSETRWFGIQQQK
jgi:hypothetical protein